MPSSMTIARRLLGTAAATVDRAVVAAMQMKNASVRRRAEGLSHHEQLCRLALIEQAYAKADPATHFAALAGFLRARGAPTVGAMGMSLGGYSTALFATVDDALGFAVPIIPLASIADFARDQGRLGDAAQSKEQHKALEAANRVVSPLAR